MVMRGRNQLLAMTLFVVAAFTLPAAAQNVESGFRLARRSCAGCHELGKAPVQNVVSPPFAAIARMPSTTTISLAAFLSSPHHRMPDYALTRQEIADVSAYILSLR